MTDLVSHFLIFIAVGVVFLIFPLLLGLLVRPKNPTSEKLSSYECGEPAIGSSYIQFDLRFYVVALLFIIFDVEVAFFFPWAMVYGNAMQLADKRIPASSEVRTQLSARLLNVQEGSALNTGNIVSADTAYKMGVTGLMDILVFFGVLLVGFAYVWKRGDLDWVRNVTEGVGARTPLPPSPPVEKATSYSH
ncbi:MAG: NADH-quinone oxidoreductase subunit A [Planctomycetales bacterium]